MNHMNHGHALPHAPQPPPPPPFHPQGNAAAQHFQPLSDPYANNVPQHLHYQPQFVRPPANAPQGAQYNVTPNIQLVNPETRSDKVTDKPAPKAETSLKLNSNGKVDPFYEGYTFSRLPAEKGQKVTWARVVKTAMPVSHGDLAVQIRKQQARGDAAIKQYNEMGSLRKAQVDLLITEKNKSEKDRRLEWKLASIKTEAYKSEIKSMQVIVKRILKPDVIQSSTAKPKSPIGGDIVDLNKPEKKPENVPKPSVPLGQGHTMPIGVTLGAGTKVYHTQAAPQTAHAPMPQMYSHTNGVVNPGFPERGPQYHAQSGAYHNPNPHHGAHPPPPPHPAHPGAGAGAHHGGPPPVEIIHDDRVPREILPQSFLSPMVLGAFGSGSAHPMPHQGIHPGGHQGPQPRPQPGPHPGLPQVINDRSPPNGQQPPMPNFQHPQGLPKEYHQQAGAFAPGQRAQPQPQPKPFKKERVHKWRETIIDGSDSESESESSVFSISDADTPVSSTASKEKRKDKHRRDSNAKDHRKRDSRRSREVPTPAPAPTYREHQRRPPLPPLSPKESKEHKAPGFADDSEEYVVLPAKTFRDGTAEFRRMMAQSSERPETHRRGDSYGREERYPTGGLLSSGVGRYNNTSLETHRSDEASYRSGRLDDRDLERELYLEKELNKERERRFHDQKFRERADYPDRPRGFARDFELRGGSAGRYR